jgi:uncharacterized protein YqeY
MMDDPRIGMQDALKQAMVNKDALRRDVLRMTLSAFKQIEIDERRTLNAEEAMAALQKEVKKRRESIDEARRAGRDDIAEQEELELSVITGFLPRQLSREEIVAIVRETIAETDVSSAKEMGKLMGALMPKVKGLADGKLVNEVVRDLLSNA